MTAQEMDNLQRMLDPTSPMDFMHESLRHDWLHYSVRFWRCDIAF